MSELSDPANSHSLLQRKQAQQALGQAVQHYLDRTIALQSNLQDDTHTTVTSRIQNNISEAIPNDTPGSDKFSNRARAQVQLYQMCNSFLLINTLPPELLHRIFQLVAFETIHIQYSTPIPCIYQENDHLRLIPLTHVCSYWRRILLNTPSFWSRFVFDSHYLPEKESERAKVYLDRAGSMPQSLSLHDHPNLETMYLRYLKSIPQVMEPRLENLTQLGLLNFRRIRLVEQTLRSWLSRGKPGVLQSLFIHMDESIKHPSSIHTGSCSLRQRNEAMLGPVRVLSLRGIIFAWDSPVYRNLVVLRIGDIHRAASPTIHELLEILSNCPRLHTLRLYSVKIRESGSTSLMPVHLAHLVHLNLALLSPNSVGRLLSRIFLQAKDISLRIAFPSWIGSAFVVMHPFLARTNVTRLFIELCDGLEPSIALDQCLSALPNLHTLVLHLNRKHGDSFISGLTYLDESSNKYMPRCPRLHTVYFVKGSVTIAAVQTVIEAYPSIRKLRFLGCYVEPFEDMLRHWLEPVVQDIEFSQGVDLGSVFDWHHVMT